ncbi:MAG: cell division protein FtsZ [Verrucomicrobiales bacterium]
MIAFDKNRPQSIPESSVKIVGLGGAGANMLDRVALDGLEGAELLALNTDVRTLASSVAAEKVQLGRNLTKGLGAGGDPELGERAVQEAEEEVMKALEGRKIVFICVGLGGGTGSGAAPIVTRLAREAGAFTVVFATMPFAFEGRRRREQAERALNELAVLSNALVTFDNGRMGELVLPKQGVHEAFAAADRMISDSINAVARLVLRPGLINVGLDELMTALDTTRSRCLFGSGLARGENRAQGALKAALASPLLDRGTLLKEASTVLVHVCGGEDMTLYEVELLMESLTKHVPADSHLLFGAATDPAMKDALSITIISALPEDQLQSGVGAELGKGVTAAAAVPEEEEPQVIEEEDVQEEEEEPTPEPVDHFEPEEDEEEPVLAEEEAEEEAVAEELDEEEEEGDEADMDFVEVGSAAEVKEEPLAEEAEDEELEDENEEEEVEEEVEVVRVEEVRKKGPVFKRLEAQKTEEEDIWDELDDEPDQESEPEQETEDFVDLPPREVKKEEKKERQSGGQAELELDGGPKGRFTGEEPNLLDGEDLDVPPYLRNKRRH